MFTHVKTTRYKPDESKTRENSEFVGYVTLMGKHAPAIVAVISACGQALTFNIVKILLISRRSISCLTALVSDKAWTWGHG
jgi:hypothetical protein